jgi:isopentenyl-diphosphate delta-isomerase
MVKDTKQYPPVFVVDENDNEIGSAMLTEVWEKGLYHRIVSVFVEDDLGRILLQLRSPTVKVYPSRWDQAVGGHVDEGHSYEQTATHEVAEEIGLHNVELTVLDTYRSSSQDANRIINQFERIYSAHVPHDVVLQPEAGEVSKLQWFTAAELKARIIQHPRAFTPGLLYGLQKYYPSFTVKK